MTAALRASGPLPAESDDPLNRLLEAFEGQVAALVENGLEVQLRARLSRLLPEPAVTAAAGDIDRALMLANAAQFCERAARAATTPARRAEAAAHAAFLRGELLALTRRAAA